MFDAQLDNTKAKKETLVRSSRELSRINDSHDTRDLHSNCTNHTLAHQPRTSTHSLSIITIASAFLHFLVAVLQVYWERRTCLPQPQDFSVFVGKHFIHASCKFLILIRWPPEQQKLVAALLHIKGVQIPGGLVREGIHVLQQSTLPRDSHTPYSRPGTPTTTRMKKYARKYQM